MPRNNRTRENDVSLTLKLPRDLRDQFVAVCQQQDTSAARELRHHIRAYLERHRQGKLPLDRQPGR